MGKLKDGLDGLGAAVEDNGVAHFFALEGDIDRCLSRNGEKGLLRNVQWRLEGDEELPRTDAEEEVLKVGDDDGSVLCLLEGGQLAQLLEHSYVGIGVGELLRIHVSLTHHLGPIRVVTVHIGAVLVALLLGGVHLLLGHSGKMLLELEAGLDDLQTLFFACHFQIKIRFSL